MRIRNGASLVLVCAAALALNACGGGSEESGEDPKIRLLNLSAGYTALDLMTNLDSDDDDDDETQATGVALETVSDYATLDPDDYTVKVRRTGSGSVLRSFAGEELVEDTINTYVAYGEVGNFGALRIDDTLDEADAGESKLNVANVSSAGALDVYLTDATTDLDDTTPVLSSVGAALSLVVGRQRQLSPARHRGRRYRRRAPRCPDFTLTDQGVATLILTSTQGGMLANAIFLPQEGQPTKYHQYQGAPAWRGGPGEWRECVDPGRWPVGAQRGHGRRDRQPLHAARRGFGAGDADGEWRRRAGARTSNLTAGADYTLLVWSNANGPQTSLINDDNRLPAGGRGTKLRLLNGMSTLAAPITLSVDFSPVIEGTLVGQVSDEIEIGPVPIGSSISRTPRPRRTC